MSTATGTVTAPSLRRLPFTVCLAPDFVNALKKQLPEAPTSIVSGLLFGINDKTTVHVRQAYPCAFHADKFNGTSALPVALAEAQKAAESRALSVVGWYAFRDTTGLQPADIDFHSRYFPRPGDLAVITRPETPAEDVFELYSRSLDGTLSEDDYRWGLLRSPNSAYLTASAEVTMRSPVRDDFFLRAYEQTYVSGEEGRTIAGFLPVVADASRRLGVWLAVLLTFGLAAAVVFLVVRYERTLTGQNALTNSNSPLGLKVQAQGGRLLVTWDRSIAATQSAKSGLLLIEDGDRRRTLTLDTGQVANGSVLYTPNSAQVTLRLQVTTAEGKTTDETLRVLDASKDNGDAAKPLQLQPLTERNASAPNPLVASRKVTGIKPPPPPVSQNSPATSQPASPGLDENEMARQSSSGNVAPNTPITKQEEAPATTQKPLEQAQTAIPQTAPPIIDAPKKTEPAANMVAEPAAAQLKVPPPQEQPSAAAPATVTGPTNTRPSSYLAPRPVRQVMPDTHFLATGITANGGRVEVTVKIDDRGRVTEAQLNNPEKKISSALTSAALNAARQWKFDPASMNGKVIASEHTIVFVFNPAVR